ncbi:hypothetical protein [Pseudomonas sediminis]|uniref:Uncharacterized protein n=1 Tax=Pseudomonas sediminis TaxID=1691904 RepID=A0A2G5FRP7_9PSED|nr:hypothetical protein [Pseudomonas sediminis]PIA70718.1 hypothetical protein CDO35_06920 [Pseudomonas sediminis]
MIVLDTPSIVMLGLLLINCIGVAYWFGRMDGARTARPADPRLASTQAETRSFLKGLTAALVAMSVKGRAPGSSDHASPIRRTEARAERTLEHPPP